MTILERIMRLIGCAGNEIQALQIRQSTERLVRHADDELDEAVKQVQVQGDWLDRWLNEMQTRPPKRRPPKQGRKKS